MDFAMDTVTDLVITNVHQNQRRAEPIPKPKGNYVDVPGACELSKSKLKEYHVNFLWFLLINHIIQYIYIINIYI
jgi:ABC-type thiamine transport system substrate-binding protein